MANENGTSGRRRLRVTPAFCEYEIERDGEVVVLQGYKAGDACPIWVTIEVQAATDRYQESIEAIADGEKRLGKYLQPHLEQRRDILLAVVRGLTEHEASIMAAEGGDWQPILVELGWWKTDASDVPADEDDDDPEAAGGASTTDDSSPDLVSTTPVTIGSV